MRTFNIDNIHTLPRTEIDNIACLAGVDEEDIRDFETVELLALIGERLGE